MLTTIKHGNNKTTTTMTTATIIITIKALVTNQPLFFYSQMIKMQ